MIKSVVFLFSLIFFFALPAKSQIKHLVAKGETVFQIAKKYEVTPFDIYRLNPDAKSGISEKTILLIPKSFSEKSIIHKVQEKETLYSISKKYNITLSDIQNWNKDIIMNGLRVGQNIYVSTPNTKDIIISRDHTLKNDITSISNSTTTEYQVQSKETIYSISKKFNISQEELVNLNPYLKNGLKTGMLIQVPPIKSEFNSIQSNDSIFKVKNKVNLILTADTYSQKNLILLLPFNLNKIESDTLKTKTEQIKSNKFLNLTLDFYAGAQMAIDSAKVLGLPVNVKIFDVESSKYSSNVASIISKNNFENVDVVIGPFQNSAIETAAQLLEKYNIPVISPLSKERGLPINNLYYSIPSENLLKVSLFNYFKAKNGNVIAIISSRKVTSKEYILEKHPEVKHAVFNEKGALDVALLKKQLVKGQKNFVLMEIEKASTILNVTNILKGLQKEYDIQLAVFELYDALNFEEIPMTNLTDLKMVFPSITKVAETPEEKIFEKEFKKINNIYPNAAAKKGFDVTFDAMLRICQPEGFVNSAATTKTEYIENAFDYTSNNGMITNNATYLLYYDSDLTIKQAQ